MIKITAFCEEERGCPLYKKGARLEFLPPAVTGVDAAPVCAVAVEALQKAVGQIASGRPHENFARTFCGGCPSGKAWWSFEEGQEEWKTATFLANAQVVLNRVSRMNLFRGVHIVKLMRIVSLMQQKRLKPREVVITRGVPGEAFYIVLEGECEVVQHDDHQVESTLANLPPGECFGEMSLITGEPASATVRAKGETSLLLLSMKDFQKMLTIAPEIAITLARILANRLATTGRKVIEELRKGILGRLELISPAELIQAMNVNGQTGMLILQNGERSLRIYMHDGQICEAEAGEKRGEDAFYEFLTWTRGNFRFEPMRKDSAARQMSMDTVGLLLEGMRRVDVTRETAVRP